MNDADEIHVEANEGCGAHSENKIIQLNPREHPRPLPSLWPDAFGRLGSSGFFNVDKIHSSERTESWNR